MPVADSSTRRRRPHKMCSTPQTKSPATNHLTRYGASEEARYALVRRGEREKRAKADRTGSQKAVAPPDSDTSGLLFPGDPQDAISSRSSEGRSDGRQRPAVAAARLPKRRRCEVFRDARRFGLTLVVMRQHQELRAGARHRARYK